MPASKPEISVLLEAATDYLEQELLPTLEGNHRFQCRVTVNVLRQVHRELLLGPTHAARECERLRALLGHDGDRETLTRELARRIRDGSIPIDDATVLEHLRTGLEEALRINNPKWIGE